MNNLFNSVFSLHSDWLLYLKTETDSFVLTCEDAECTFQSITQEDALLTAGEVTEAAASLATEKAASRVNLAKAMSFSHPII